jgi:hypothetical protein
MQPPFGGVFNEKTDVEIEIVGPALKGKLSGRPCAYCEVVVGRMNRGQWRTLTVAYRSNDGRGAPCDVRIRTPSGEMEIPLRDVDLILKPSHAARPTVAELPEWMMSERNYTPDFFKDMLDEEGRLELREYALPLGKPFYALLRIDTYSLPPDPLPRIGRHAIARIADRPFAQIARDERPIPGFDGRTY